MTIGQKIREIREEKGMTLDQVGNISRISKQQLQAIEVSSGYPRIQTLIKIAKALGCPVRDILNEPLNLGLPVTPTKDTDFPCKNADKCPFFKKKE